MFYSSPQLPDWQNKGRYRKQELSFLLVSLTLTIELRVIKVHITNWSIANPLFYNHMICNHMSRKFVRQQANSRIALSYLEVKNIYQLFTENYVMTSNIVVL